MYLLILVLLFPGGGYREIVEPHKDRSACEAAMPEARDEVEKRLPGSDVIAYSLACNAVQRGQV